MLALLKYVTLIPRLVFIVQAVVAFIESVKEHEPGTDKKAAAMESIRDGWGIAQEQFKIKEPFDVLEPVLSYLIDLAVSVYNMVGYFRKKDNPS